MYLQTYIFMHKMKRDEKWQKSRLNGGGMLKLSSYQKNYSIRFCFNGCVILGGKILCHIV